jgi:uncharacterized protein
VIIDGHVRVGPSREAALDADGLLATMDELGIERTLVCPGEAEIAYANRAGNDRVLALARAQPERLAAYAVATPWAGDEALAELRRAHAGGAVALAIDPALQGFDLLDGLADPLLRYAADVRWPVYIRTGTPPTGLPLQAAELALRHPDVTFVMGRSGATDFVIDAQHALRRAPNLYADTAHVAWDGLLAALADDPEIGVGRIVFSTDAPYAIPRGELERLLDWPLAEKARAQILGATWSGLLARQDRTTTQEGTK